MVFTDKATILVQAGKGGDGKVSFHREKYVASGGPDGGDGGRGGNIVVKADDHLATLLDFRYKRKYAAQDAQNGDAGRRSGRDGEDLVISVPRGTLIFEKESGALLADMSGGEPFILARGGRGGWGNKHFATPSRQTPHFAKSGLPGEAFEAVLELKLLADVGLVGFPNVGKSSLLSVISAARPKIADYHFTTLTPNLGVVRVGHDRSFVCADIPGLVEGAAGGAGLGHEFLRHIERCRLLVHVVDISGLEGRDPCGDYDTIRAELSAHDPELALREQIVAANKTDVLSDTKALETLTAHVAPVEVYPVSAATTEGIDVLINAIADKLSALPPVKVYQPETMREREQRLPAQTKITHNDGVWVVTGEWIERLMRDINFDDYESRMYFNGCLKRHGLFEQLEDMGIEEKDTVSVCGFEFEYFY